MADELLDICDESNHLTGIQKMKTEAHRDGLWHRTAHIWIYNSNGEILLQLRAKDKPLFPDMWDISAAGHVGVGEEPIVSGLREVEEEIGLKVKPEDLQFFDVRKTKTIYRDIVNNEFYYIYFLKFNGEINQLKLQDEEVQKIKFFPIDKIEEELRINSNKYAPHQEYWLAIFDEARRRFKM